MSSGFSLVPLRILLVGIQRLLCDSLQQLIEADKECIVVGKPASVQEAVNCLQALHPTLIIADLDLPIGINIQLVEQLA